MSLAKHLPVTAFVSLALLACSIAASAATYEVRFDATWSSTTHPDAYPRGAHFSPLIGATHNDQVVFWEAGGIASPGIEQMAESGGTFRLRSEFAAAGNAVHSIVQGAGINSPATTSIDFEIIPSHSSVTLVTMVAPSPDWFVGLSGIDLREGGVWAREKVIELIAYDSGTDSGPDFTSRNADITPHIPIAVVDQPLLGTPPLGTFTFTLLVPETACSILMLLAFGWTILWRFRREVHSHPAL